MQPGNTDQAAPNPPAALTQTVAVPSPSVQSLALKLQTTDQPGSQPQGADQASSPHYANPPTVEELPAAAMFQPAEAPLKPDPQDVEELWANGQNESGEQVWLAIYLESSSDDDDGNKEEVSEHYEATSETDEHL